MLSRVALNAVLVTKRFLYCLAQIVVGDSFSQCNF
jgi:hypothetical protein